MDNQTIQSENLFDEPEDVGDYHLLRNLVQARRQSGRKATSVLYDIARLSWKTKRVIDPEFYFKHRLFDLAESDTKAMYGYLDPIAMVKLNKSINFDRQSLSAIDNKTYLEHILRAEGLPVVKTLAILSENKLSPSKGCSSVEEAVTFFRNCNDYPIFGKPNQSSRSAGVTSVTKYDRESDTLTLENKGGISPKQFAEELFRAYGEFGYIFQSKLEPHDSLKPCCGNAIGCIRLLTLAEPDNIVPLYSVWKIPANGEIADNFWRSDNKVAAIDTNTGLIQRVQAGTGVQRTVELKDPISGIVFSGFQLPDWERLVKLGCEAAALFQHIPVLGWDIAMTQSGPVIVEGNTNPDHSLYQLAYGTGLASSEAGLRLRNSSDLRKSRRKKAVKEMKKKIRDNAKNKAKKAVTQGFDVSS